MRTTCSSPELRSNPERFLKGTSGANNFGLSTAAGRVWLSQAVHSRLHAEVRAPLPRTHYISREVLLFGP